MKADEPPTEKLGSCTCHASNNPRCFNDVSSLHVLCCNDPSFSLTSSYQGDISRPARRQTRLSVFSILSVHIRLRAVSGLTCTGRIALQQPSPQKAGPLRWLHTVDDGSLPTGIFVYDHRQCHVYVFFL